MRTSTLNASGAIVTLLVCLTCRTASAGEAQDIWAQIQSLEKQSSTVIAIEMATNPNYSPLTPNQEDFELTMKLVALEERLGTLAKKGDPAAQYFEGVRHVKSGLLAESVAKTDQDHARADDEFKAAMNWWRPLADKGDAPSQFQLGMLYEQGQGVIKSPLNAVEWYYKAAMCYRKAGDREQALTVLDAMRKLDPDHPLTKKAYRTLVGGEAAAQ
jgi:hypothetical protein